MLYISDHTESATYKRVGFIAKPLSKILMMPVCLFLSHLYCLFYLPSMPKIYHSSTVPMNVMISLMNICHYLNQCVGLLSYVISSLFPGLFLFHQHNYFPHFIFYMTPLSFFFGTCFFTLTSSFLKVCVDLKTILSMFFLWLGNFLISNSIILCFCINFVSFKFKYFC